MGLLFLNETVWLQKEFTKSQAEIFILYNVICSEGFVQSYVPIEG